MYPQRHLPERSDRRYKMVEPEETAFYLLITYEQLAKAIELPMRDIHNPPPGSLRWMPPLLVSLLPHPLTWAV
jgi:hypothetical protein